MQPADWNLLRGRNEHKRKTKAMFPKIQILEENVQPTGDNRHYNEKLTILQQMGEYGTFTHIISHTHTRTGHPKGWPRWGKRDLLDVFTWERRAAQCVFPQARTRSAPRKWSSVGSYLHTHTTLVSLHPVVSITATLQGGCTSYVCVMQLLKLLLPSVYQKW